MPSEDFPSLSFAFRDATKEDLGFDPEAPYLGRPDLKTLLNEVRRGWVIMRMIKGDFRIVFIDIWRHLMQFWAPPRRTFTIVKHSQGKEPLQPDLLIDIRLLKSSGIAPDGRPPKKLTFEGDVLDQWIHFGETARMNEAQSAKVFQVRGEVKKVPGGPSPDEKGLGLRISLDAPTEEDLGKKVMVHDAHSTEVIPSPEGSASAKNVVFVAYKEDHPIDFLCNEGFTTCGIIEFSGEEMTPERALRALSAAGFQFQVVEKDGSAATPLEVDAADGTSSGEAPNNRESPTQLGTAAGNEQRYVFKQDGELWSVRYGDERGTFTPIVGLIYIVHLLRNQGRGFSAEELIRLAMEPQSDVPSKVLRADSQEFLAGQIGVTAESNQAVADKEALRDYRRRLAEIPAAQMAAREAGDTSLLEELEEEEVSLKRYLAEIQNIRGGSRLLADSQRSRFNSVKQAIERTKNKFLWAQPPLRQLHDHLSKSLVLSDRVFEYRPRQPAPAWEF